MAPFYPRSTSEQLTEHLRLQIQTRALSGTLPGIRKLVKSFGVNSVAITKAIHQLEREGLILHQGDRKPRQIAILPSSPAESLKIGMLYYSQNNAKQHHALLLKEALNHNGHHVIIPQKSMIDLEMNTERITTLVSNMNLDAWVIYAGSRDTLKWFERNDLSAFALYGRFNQTSLAGIGILRQKVTESLLKKLIALGHKRIVLLVREERRKPELGTHEKAFIHQLEANGIETSSYHVPDWDESPAGLETVINSLCKHTPPTALLIDDATLLHAIQMLLAARGIFAPDHISLICFDHQASFEWTSPMITNITWDHRPVVRRVVQWAKNIAQGKADHRKSYIKAQLNEGGTIGPPP